MRYQPTAGGRPRARRVLARYAAAAGLARLADEMVGLAMVLLALSRTGRPVLAGALVTAYTLPVLASGPVLGAWLDRTRHRRPALMVNLAVLAGASVGIAASLARAPVAVPLLLAAVAGVTLPMTSGGFTSLLPRLLPPDRLGRANAVDAVTFNTAAVAGPAVSGALAALAGPDVALVAVALVASAGLAATAGVPVPPPAADRPAGVALLTQVRAGLGHLARTAPLRGATLTTVLGYGAVGMLAVALPLYTRDLGAGEEGAGLLWGALEVGGLAASLSLAYRPLSAPPQRVVYAATALFGLAMASWPLAGSMAVAAGLVALAGAASGPALPAILAVRQRYAPANLLAQVSTTGASLKIGGYAVGATLGGVVVPALGPTAAIALVAATEVSAAGLGALLGRPTRSPGQSTQDIRAAAPEGQAA
jgi:predicted MFS family arabinose efflux permease